MEIIEYFKTPIWVENKIDFVKSLNKSSDKYIKKAREKNKDYIKKYGDFGISHHSTPLTFDNNFIDFRNYIGQKSWEFLNWQGFDMQQYTTMFSEMWVQEFAKKAAVIIQRTYIGINTYRVFIFKASDKTSMPVFHEPRTGARATKLKLKEPDKIVHGTELVHFKPQPGSLIIFPGYLEHEFSVDHGVEPFRFIHWNIQAVPKEIAKDV